ncbi:unnamed protein product, partial [Rotaria sordida]
MGAQSSSYKILYGERLGQWEGLPGFFSLWRDRDDADFEATRTLDPDHRASPLFKLQGYFLLGSYRIVLRDYSSERQITVIENCSSRPDARLAYESLLSVLQDEDMRRPETVARALRRHHTPIGGRFQHVGNPAHNRFPEAMLQPVDASWNPVDFEADIILVHGLDGDPMSTWTNRADPTPSIGVNAGNLTRLADLNQFFLNSNIPFLNFSEGTITPQIWWAWLVNVVIVSDAQTYMNAPDIVTGADLAGQLALNILPARVHYHYPDCHHLDIAKPSTRENPTYHYTKIYVAHWIRRRPVADNLQGVTDWDQYAGRIVNT